MTFIQKDLPQSHSEMWDGIKDTIKKHGRCVLAVTGDPVDRNDGNEIVKPEFFYSLGNCIHGNPELLCFWPSKAITQHVINNLSDMCKDGKLTITEEPQYVPGLIEGFDVKVMLLTGYAREVAAEKYAIQLPPTLSLALVTLPDREGNWPHQDGYQPFAKANLPLIFR